MSTDRVIQMTFRFSGRNGCLPWFPKVGNRNHLAKLFCDLGFTKGVEIGTNHGKFASVLCSENPNLHLTCVDPWMEYSDGVNYTSGRRQDLIYEEAVQTLSKFNVQIIRKTSMEAVREFSDQSIDFVNIDGNHMFDFAMMDIINWSSKVKPEGVICVHDYHPYGGMGIVCAVNSYTHCHHIDPWYVTREELATAYWVKK